MGSVISLGYHVDFHFGGLLKQNIVIEVELWNARVDRANA